MTFVVYVISYNFVIYVHFISFVIELIIETFTGLLLDYVFRLLLTLLEGAFIRY